MTDPMRKGAELEQRLSQYFRLNDYQVETNRRLEGRSGAIHEIDILARRVDGITEFHVAVECKAWSAPIEKDVVSKLAMVMADVGVHKGIIASLQGWRVGAEHAARQAGIELWGPDELAQRLGRVALAELGAVRANRRVVSALARAAVSPRVLNRALAAQVGGVFGIGREERIWAAMAWVPYHLLAVRCAAPVTELFRRPTTKAAPRWLVYNALNDQRFAVLAARPALVDEPVQNAIPPRTRPKAIADALVKTVARLHDVGTDAARQRHAARAEELGLPPDVAGVTVEETALVHRPFWVGRFKRRGMERLVAIDAVTGLFDAATSAALTENLSFVDAAVDAADRALPTG